MALTGDCLFGRDAGHIDRLRCRFTAVEEAVRERFGVPGDRRQVGVIALADAGRIAPWSG